MGTFRPALVGRWFFLSMFGVFGLTGLVMVVQAIGGRGPSIPFLLFWLFALVWNAYWWLLRFAYCVTVREDGLDWEAPLRHGDIPAAELIAVGRSKLVPNAIVIEHAGGRPVYLLHGKGLTELASAIGSLRPDIDVHLGRLGRVQQRMPGRSAWRPREQ
jgi:hypothetical protein